MNPDRLNAEQKLAVNRWLGQHGHKNRNENGWYDDCQMIDDICHDLALEQNRTEVGEMVDWWIARRSSK